MASSKLTLVILLVVIGITTAKRRFPVEKILPAVDANTEAVPFQAVDENFRLPNETVPSHYTLRLKTLVHDEGDRDFQGSVDIHLEVVAVTNKITVHNRGLEIKSSKLFRVVNDDLVEINQPTNTYDERTEQLTFHSSSILEIASYVLRIIYTGRLTSGSSTGFFRKFYRDENNNRRYVAATQFEPTRARMALPCYDEPTLKATFTVSITHHHTYNAVSNMPRDGPLVVDPLDPDFVTTSFEKIPRMSTYLLTFAVTDFETRTRGQHEIHARSNAIDQTKLGLEVADKVLLEFNQYTDVSYFNYMPKLGQIAIPDRGTGAMENWGLVQYGEPVLLYDSTANTYRVKFNIVTIIAHEYAHQWFGNLVTTDWWKYIWLNEGFACLYGYYGAHLAYPDEGYMDFFQLYELQVALAQDSTVTTRPMNWNANTPAEISALFDSIAYSKSGSVLNMFRTIFGDDNWRNGLKKYLLDREMAAAVDDDLYAALQSAITEEHVLPEGMTVKQVMESWTNAAGYPVLNVRRNYQTNEVIISQERFFSDRKLPNDHIWHIPFNVANEKDMNFQIDSFKWLTTKAQKISLDVEPHQWLIFNRQQLGYYRVNYDTRNWDMIIAAMTLHPNSIHKFNRAQLIDDAYNLARADLLDFSVVLRMLFALSNDHDYLPWYVGNNVLTYLHGKLRGTSHFDKFERYVRTLIENHYRKLEVDAVDADETLNQKYFKQLISTWACRIGFTDCLERAETNFKAAIQGKLEVHPDIQSVIFCYGVQHASDEEFLWLYHRMFDSKNEAERSVLISALGCSLNKDHLDAYLTSSIGAGVGTETNYYESESNQVIRSVYSASRTGVDALIDFLNDWDLADDFIYWLEQPAFNNAVANIASRTNTQDEFDRLLELFETIGSLAPETVVEAAKATVKRNFDWYDSLEGLVVVEFLERNFS